MEHQNDMQHIPLSQIHRSDTLNPRRHRNAAKFEKMIESVRDNGVIQPIVVRPSPTQEGMYEVVAGDTRFEASQSVSLDTIPAIIRSLSDQEAKLLATTENLQRADLSPLEEAWAAADILNANNQNHEDARKQLGWSRSKLDNRLLLSHCIDEVSKALIDGEIKIGHAEIMASLSAENQRHVLKRVLDDGMTVEQTRERMKQITPALRHACFDTTDCQSCRHNSASNADLFASADEKQSAVCYHKPCFDKKTDDACQIIVKDTQETYGRVHLDTEVTNDGYTVIVSTDDTGNGVGAEQAAACAGCEHFGAIVRTGYGRAGSVIHNACFNLECHAEKREAYKQLVAQVSTDTDEAEQQAGNSPTGNTETSTDKSSSNKTPAAGKKKSAAPDTLRKGVKKLAFGRFADATRETIKHHPDYALAIALVELIKNVSSACTDAREHLKAILAEYSTEEFDIAKATTGVDRDAPNTLVSLAALGTRSLSLMMVDVAALMAYRDDSADHFEKSQSGKTNLTILSQCATNTAEWVVVDKKYLDAQTKGVILKDAKDSGFSTAYDSAKGEGAFADLAKGKVSDIKSAILGFEDFDWQGYEPYGFRMADYSYRSVVAEAAPEERQEEAGGCDDEHADESRAA